MEKTEKMEYDVCYSMPLILGTPFRTPNNTYEMYEYEVKSEIGESFNFSFYSPNYLGPLFQISQKFPVVVKNEVLIKRQKIHFAENKQNPVFKTNEEFETMRGTNRTFWEIMFPAFNDTYQQEENPNRLPISKEALSEEGIRKLRKTYLISNSIIENLSPNGDRLEIDDSILSLNESITKQSIGQIFIDKRPSERKHVIVRAIIEVKPTTTLHEFIKKLNSVVNPDSKDEQSFFHSNFSGGLNPTTLRQPLIDYIQGLPNTSGLKPVQKMLQESARYLGKDLGPDMLCVVIPASTFLTFDNNFSEGLEKWVSNLDYSKGPIPSGSFNLIHLSCLKRLPLNIEEFESLQRIIPTLVQIERIAQIREFKLYFDLPYMHDHLVFKSLNSRGLDKRNNYETLETLGDTVLKTLVTCNLFLNNPGRDQEWITKEKVKVISNEYLCRRVLETPVKYFLKVRYQKAKHFVPPFFTRKNPEAKNGGGFDYSDSQIISGKMTADCFEALLGRPG